MGGKTERVQSVVICLALLSFCVVSFASLGYSFYVFRSEMAELRSRITDNEKLLAVKNNEIAELQESNGKVKEEIARTRERVSVLENMIQEKKTTVSTGVDVFMEHVRKRRSAETEQICLSLDQLLQMRAQNGADGKDGKDGIDGTNGKDGKDASNGGTTYVRWGRTTCGSNSSLLYEGLAAGSHFTHTGGGVNYLCLPFNPEYRKTATFHYGDWIYGAEYESFSNGIFPPAAHDQNVPCARCLAQQRTAQMMIVARRSCPESWTKEYEGYLMSGHYGHQRSAEYTCVDMSPEYIAGEQANTNGALFYFVRASCGGLRRCPPYIEAALTCVVCTK